MEKYECEKNLSFKNFFKQKKKKNSTNQEAKNYIKKKFCVN